MTMSSTDYSRKGYSCSTLVGFKQFSIQVYIQSSEELYHRQEKRREEDDTLVHEDWPFSAFKSCNPNQQNKVLQCNIKTQKALSIIILKQAFWELTMDKEIF